MVAVDLALDAPYQIAGVVALSGFVMCVEDWARKLQSKKGLRVLQLHGLEDRTIPYYQNTIYPQTIAKNRTVLIASSENAIRGLLMHLCDIPIANISNVEIPTGVPLIYDIAGRCVHLFDDGQLPKPRDRYDFGAAADVIFRPCDDDEGCPRRRFHSASSPGLARTSSSRIRQRPPAPPCLTPRTQKRWMVQRREASTSLCGLR